MKKLLKNEVCGTREQYMHCSLLKSQNMWLGKKKERKANVDPQTRIQTDT